MTKEQFEIAKAMWRDGVALQVIASHIRIRGTAGALAQFVKSRPEHFPPRQTKKAAA
jgi:hypothetical protein